MPTKKKSKKVVDQNNIIWKNVYSIYNNGELEEHRKNIKNVPIKK